MPPIEIVYVELRESYYAGKVPLEEFIHELGALAMREEARIDPALTAFLCGRIDYAAGRYATAAARFKTCIALTVRGPREPVSYTLVWSIYNAGLCALKCSDSIGAYSYFRRLLRFWKPEDPEIRYWWQCAFRECMDLLQAWMEWEKLLSLCGAYESIVNELGTECEVATRTIMARSYRNQEQFRKAATLCKRTLKKYGAQLMGETRLHFLYEFAISLYMTGEYVKSIEVYDELGRLATETQRDDGEWWGLAVLNGKARASGSTGNKADELGYYAELVERFRSTNCGGWEETAGHAYRRAQSLIYGGLVEERVVAVAKRKLIPARTPRTLSLANVLLSRVFRRTYNKPRDRDAN
jgi:tetratricopeptide (TPR) repeat protein